jgi:hypothetical protein
MNTVQTSRPVAAVRRLLPAAAAALLFCAGHASAQNAAQRAVDAAKPLCAGGKTITIVWEAGLQSLDPQNFSGPQWEKLTGCKVKVVEVPTAEMFTKIMQEYRAGTGAYDALNVIPAWMPDLVQAGALEQLDSYVDKYGFRDELKTIAPTYRDNQMTVNGKIYGFPDDGDVFVMYYRKDILGDAKLRKEFKDRYKYDLAPPKTWKQFDEMGAFLTEKLKDKGTYGAAFFRDAPYAQYMFQERFRVEGGKFFDGGTMKATVNSDVGVRVLTERRGKVRLRGKPRHLPEGRERDDHLLAALRTLRGGLPREREGSGLGAEVHGGGQGGLRNAAGRAPPACSRVRPVGRLHQQAEGSRVPVHPVAEQRGNLPQAGATALRPAGPLPPVALHQQGVPREVA